MARTTTWPLTDVARDLWCETFSTDADRLPLPGVSGWSITKRVLRGGLRDGVEVVEVDNGTLAFTVLPTRGMGLWRGHVRGVREGEQFDLGWKAPVRGPVHPKFVEQSRRNGIGWLDGFDEWLCRCGLASMGPPGDDTHDGHRTSLALHGRIANSPAHYLEVSVRQEPPFELSVTGQVEEGGLFSPRLLLTSTVSTVPGGKRLTIHDRVENLGGKPAEFELLYHCNIGPPILDAGARLSVPCRVMAPATARAGENVDTASIYAGPVAGFAEEVYLYEPLTDRAGNTAVMLCNAGQDLGQVIRFNRNELPCFTQWKNTAAEADGYVTGLEPGTNFPNFRSFERAQGRLQVLPPGGRWQCRWSIEACTTTAEVAAARREINAIQESPTAKIFRHPNLPYSPG